MYHTQREDGPVGDTLGAPARSSVIRISAPLPARRPEEVDGPHGVAELALPVDLVGGHGNLGQRQGGGGDGREAHIGWERDLHNFKRGRDCRCVCRGMIGCYPEWRDAALIWTQGGRWIRGEGILVDTRYEGVASIGPAHCRLHGWRGGMWARAGWCGRGTSGPSRA